MIDNFRRYWVQELWRKCEEKLRKVANYYHASVINNRLLITLDRELPESSHYSTCTMQDLCYYITMDCGLVTKKVSNKSFEVLLDNYFRVYVGSNVNVNSYNVYNSLQLNEITTLHDTERKNEYAINFQIVLLQELFELITKEYSDIMNAGSKTAMINAIGRYNKDYLSIVIDIPTQYYQALGMNVRLEFAKLTMKLWNVGLHVSTAMSYQHEHSLPYDIVLHDTSVRMNDSYNLEVTYFSLKFPLDSTLIATTKELINSKDDDNKELAIAGIYDEPYKYMVNPFHQQLFKSLFHELP